MGYRARKTVGVIGGLGPEATVHFLSRLIAATPAICDQDHIHVLVDHNPAIPNRHDAIAGNAPSIAPLLVDMAKNLERSGADFLVMVCNTAHAYADELSAAISIPFYSIIDTTVAALEGLGVCKVGILAADGCLRANLYQHALRSAGYRSILLDRASQQILMELVYRIKAGERGNDIGKRVAQLAAVLTRDGAEALIAGCTEIPLVFDQQHTALPLLSSTELLVARVVELAGESELV